MSFRTTPLKELVPLHHRVRQYPRRHPKTVALVVAVVLILSLIDIGYSADWSGFSGQTLWDWLELLIVPAVLAVGGYLFTRAENRNSQKVAEQRTQDEALQWYLDQISQLITGYRLRNSISSGDASASARAVTLTVLDRLDGDRKARVLRFLHDSGLIKRGRVVSKNRLIEEEQTIVKLADANLSGLNLLHPPTGALRRAKFYNTALEDTDLRGADLRLAILAGSDLRRADLSEVMARSVHLEQTNLENASLIEADLGAAWLNHARLVGANMRRTELRSANFHGADLGNTTGDIMNDTMLIDADLQQADLTNANLQRVAFGRANLVKTNFTGANMQDANLSNADLTDAIITDEQLASCRSYDNAVMPNGLLPDGSVPDKPQPES